MVFWIIGTDHLLPQGKARCICRTGPPRTTLYHEACPIHLTTVKVFPHNEIGEDDGT